MNKSDNIRGDYMAGNDINLRRTLLGGLKADEYQTDIAHMVYFAYHGLPFNSLRSDSNKPIGDANRVKDIPECSHFCKKTSLECKAEQNYDSWFNSLVCRSTPPKHVSIIQQKHSAMDKIFAANQCISQDTTSYIESLMLCSKPNAFNTGSHRVVAIFWLSGERYGIAFEEGGGPSKYILKKVFSRYPAEYAMAFLSTFIQNTRNENVFIEGLTKKAKHNVQNTHYLNDVVIPSIIYAMTGYNDYKPAHHFSINVYDSNLPNEISSPDGQWFNGCSSSKEMYPF